MKSPYTTKTERGAYSAIVYIDGDLCVAEDNVGTIIGENTDAATVIKAARDSITNGSIYIKNGTYLINSVLDFDGKSGFAIIGESHKTIIKQGAAIDHVIGISDQHASQSNDITLAHFTVEGDPTKGVGNNIVVGNLKRGLIYDINSINSWRTALTILRTTEGAANAQYLPEHVQVIGGIYSRNNSGDGPTFCIGGRFNVVNNVFIDAQNHNDEAFIIYDNTFNRSYNLVAIRPVILNTESARPAITCSVDNSRIISPIIFGSGYYGIRVAPNGEQCTEASGISAIRNVSISSPIIDGVDGIGIAVWNSQDIEIIGGVIQKSGSMGVDIESKTLFSYSPNFDTRVRISGLTVRNNALSADSRGVVIKNVISGTDIYLQLNQINVYDDQGTPTQTRGVQVEGTHDVFLYMSDSWLSGSVYNFKNDNTGSNSEMNLHNVKGWEVQNTVLSGTFAIDSTGVKTVTIAHGLAITPALEDCYLTVVEDTNVDDWAFDLLKVESVGSTNVGAKIHVSTASATGSATAKLALRVGKL